MTQHFGVVIIGGGVVGCSIAYHLAKYGIRDVALIERSELAAGSSWHAAGSLFALTHPSCARVLQKYAQELYSDFENSGHSLGLHLTGGISLASSHKELTTLRIACAEGIRDGIECEIISPQEAVSCAPILSTEGLVAALYEPTRGNVDPAIATQAFADKAKENGAKIFLRNRVLQTTQKADGTWEILTETGTIRANSIVNAAGLWAREVAALAQITLPLMPVEHHYVVTEAVPEIASLTRRLPTISDNEAEFYSRQEGNGMLVGAYEKDCRHWSKEETSFDFKQELLPNDLDRILPNLERAFQRMPALGAVGLRAVINGPMIFSPDLNPLVGPHPSIKNYYLACGVMTGFNQAAGIGRLLAEWMVDGEPSLDVSAWDVARFGEWANKTFTEARTQYFYEHRHSHVYPYEEFDAGRPVLKIPIYDSLKQHGAVFGFSFGYEYPLWYAQEGENARDIPAYHRTNWHESVSRECIAVSERAGLFEISTFGKFEVTGPSAHERLEALVANRIPVRIGKTMLSPMLSHNGKLIGDFTVSRLGTNRFLLLGAGSMQAAHSRWFRDNLCSEGTQVENLSFKYCGLHVAGPRSRSILEQALQSNLTNETFPFLSCRVLTFQGFEVFVVRVSFTGELGYELYSSIQNEQNLFNALLSAGKSHGMTLVGSRSMMSMRLEKGFPSWGSDLSPDFPISEVGLCQFIKMDKEFIGKNALKGNAKPNRRRVLLSIHTDSIDAYGGEPIFFNGSAVGFTTSGGYGHRVNMSLAMAYVHNDAAFENANLAVEIAGERYLARVHSRPPHDPTGMKMRS